MTDDWLPDMTVDELDLTLGRLARIGAHLDFTLRSLWIQLHDMQVFGEIPLDVERRVDEMLILIRDWQGMPIDHRDWAMDCLLDVRIGLMARSDALQFFWIGPMRPETKWRQQRNGVPDDHNAVDVIERSSDELNELVHRLMRLNIRATALGFAMWQFTKPEMDLPHQLDQWAMVRDHFDMMPEGGCRIRD